MHKTSPRLISIWCFPSFVRCQSRIDDFASKVNLPEDWVNIDTHHPYIPQLFVVNVQVCRLSIGYTTHERSI